MWPERLDSWSTLPLFLLDAETTVGQTAQTSGEALTTHVNLEKFCSGPLTILIWKQ